MPEAVAKWAETHDFLECQAIQDDKLIGYEADFPKYRKRVDPILLRATLRSAATQRQAKNSQAEVDYLTVRDMKVLPIEVKASTQGGMKSLWLFMREKQLHHAVRCSLENFGTFNYIDNAASGTMRTVTIYPLYAMAKVEG